VTTDFQQCAVDLIEAGNQLFRWGMVPATSGNFSARLPDGTLAITVSGRHKGRLTVDDIMQVTAEGESIDGRRSSAETLLHVQIYKRFSDARVVLHPHSVNATVLSRISKDSLRLQDYELLKAFPGIDSHECSIEVPIFDNDQDIQRLAQQVEHYMDNNDGPVHGYLIAGHGFYTWGSSTADAMRHVEAFEFLFDCELLTRGLQR